MATTNVGNPTYPTTPLQEQISISPSLPSGETVVTSQAATILNQNPQPAFSTLKDYEWVIKPNLRTETANTLYQAMTKLATLLEEVKSFDNTKANLSEEEINKKKNSLENKLKLLTESILPKTQGLIQDWITALNANILFWGREKEAIAEMWEAQYKNSGWSSRSTHSISKRLEEIKTLLGQSAPQEPSETTPAGETNLLSHDLIKQLNAMLEKLVGLKECLSSAKASYKAISNPDEAFFERERYAKEFAQISSDIPSIKEKATNELRRLDDGLTDIERKAIEIKLAAVEYRKQETEVALTALAGYGRQNASQSISGQVFFESRSPIRQKVLDLMLKTVQLKENIKTHVLIKQDTSIRNFYAQAADQLLAEKDSLSKEKEAYDALLGHNIAEAQEFLTLLSNKSDAVKTLFNQVKDLISPAPKQSYYSWGWNVIAGSKEKGSN